MEILKRGIPPSERVYEATCGTCGTEVRFSQGEAHYQSDQRDGDFVMIACPVCQKAITKDAACYKGAPVRYSSSF